MFRSQDIIVFFIFNHPMIYQICDMMGVSTGCIFEYIFWFITQEVTNLANWLI